MSLVGFKARNHPQQKSVDAVDDRGTSAEFFAKMDARFGPFALDVAASSHNTKCDRWYTIDDNGLVKPWNAARIWCNPPYSNIGAWVVKAWDEWEQRQDPVLIVMLLPANRTEQKWWQEYVEPHRDDKSPALFRVEFLPGRMRFDRPGVVIGPKGDRPPFGCCLLIWGWE